MDLTLYGLKNCDTCRKALKALEAGGKTVRFIDIRAEADLSQKVPDWLSVAGADVLVNKRSTSWRGLSDAERLIPPEELLPAHATLIKRPIIEVGDAVYVGWTKTVQETLL